MCSKKNTVQKVLVVLFIASTASVYCNHIYKAEISCFETKPSTWAAFGWFLTCHASTYDTEILKILNPDTQITRVVEAERENPMSDQQRSEITALSMDKCHVNFIPQKVKEMFPKVAFFSCRNCGLMALDKDDLKQFGDDLKILWLLNNALTSLDADVFSNNPHLQSIDLSENPLGNIEPGFFHTIIGFPIKYLGLKNCLCINNFYDAGHNLRYDPNFWQDDSCRNDLKRVESYALRTSKSMGRIADTQELLSNLEKKIDELKESMLDLEMKIDLAGNKPDDLIPEEMVRIE